MLRALFFVDSPHRVAGAQRSLLAALAELRHHDVQATAVFPGTGLCVDLFREAGIEVEVLSAPPSLLTFGKKHLAAGLLGRASVLARDVLPYSVRLAALARRMGVHVW